MATLKASRNITTESNLTLKCYNMLNSFVVERSNELLWIPRDNGIRSNEIAHDLTNWERGRHYEPQTKYLTTNESIIMTQAIYVYIIVGIYWLKRFNNGKFIKKDVI